MTMSPRIDDYTAAIIEGAVESLTNLRGLACPDDPGVRLHILASLARQIDTTLTAAVIEARRHDYPRDEIAEFLGITSDASRRRYHDRHAVRD
jgi:hypothetical protein